MGLVFLGRDYTPAPSVFFPHRFSVWFCKLSEYFLRVPCDRHSFRGSFGLFFLGFFLANPNYSLFLGEITTGLLPFFREIKTSNLM